MSQLASTVSAQDVRAVEQAHKQDGDNAYKPFCGAELKRTGETSTTCGGRIGQAFYACMGCKPRIQQEVRYEVARQEYELDHCPPQSQTEIEMDNAEVDTQRSCWQRARKWAAGNPCSAIALAVFGGVIIGGVIVGALGYGQCFNAGKNQTISGESGDTETATTSSTRETASTTSLPNPSNTTGSSLNNATTSAPSNSTTTVTSQSTTNRTHSATTSRQVQPTTGSNNSITTASSHPSTIAQNNTTTPSPVQSTTAEPVTCETQIFLIDHSQAENQTTLGVTQTSIEVQRNNTEFTALKMFQSASCCSTLIDQKGRCHTNSSVLSEGVDIKYSLEASPARNTSSRLNINSPETANSTLPILFSVNGRNVTTQRLDNCTIPAEYQTHCGSAFDLDSSIPDVFSDKEKTD